ncbi:MAG: cupin, partial [Betaproteobacteria bacterium]|nr:cupin [Betaproteobacteria bacterium]MBV9361161.1 cupin [Betaproteobacteria bacterium]
MKPKQHLEFVKVDLKTGWEVPPGYPPGFYQKILATDLDETKKT